LAERGYALVTGASSGIGWEIAHILAREGFDLVLVARRVDRLGLLKEQILARTSDPRIVHVLDIDLALEDSADRVWERLSALGTPISVLVNNAGFGSFGPFLEADPDENSRMINVNIAALTRLTRLVLPAMLERGSGRILNVASVASFQPGPLMAVYYATKAYVLSLSEALSEELSGSGVTVTALCPGPTRSEFHDRAGIEHNGMVRPLKMPDAAEVALAGYRAMIRGRRVHIHGLLYRILVFVVRLVPRRLAAASVRRMQESRN
jgi:hypothetical protein